MPEFSACYFCGTALDAPLAEYPVVPDALHPAADQQKTVVLCPTCRRKVGAVVDAVVGAVDDAPDDETVQRELSESRGNGASGSSADDTVEAQRLDEGSEDDPTDDSGTERSRTDRTEDATADDGGFEFREPREEPPDDDEPAVEDASPGEDDPLADDTAPAGDTPPTANDTAPAGDETPAASGDSEAHSGAAPAADDDGASAADDDVASGGEEPEMTALEYNKVMRLLQNRDLPVDREEFKIVATNAYQLSEREFEAVIEAAAKRDLIALEGGQIVDA